MSESIVTNIAKKKILLARAGLIPNLPKIVGMAFGNGASTRLPLETDTTLQNEIYRQKVDNAVFQENELYVKYSTTLAQTTLKGQVINEIALYDEDGDLLAIKTFSDKGKDGDMEMVFEILDRF
ncbi:MAG: hypothetical protein HFG68_14580 [Hungatella sp.]|nr:hypothetical protein [Hungatella sp.]